MWKVLAFLQQRLVIAIPVMLVLGFVFGVQVDAGPLQFLVLPFTFLMVYPMMVNLRLQELTHLSDLRLQGVTQAINFLIIPFLAFGLGLWFFPEQPWLALGLLLAGLVPTSGMTISWTGMAGGNVPAAIRMTVVGLLLGALATPFYVDVLMGATLEVDLLRILWQIGVIVLLPLALGQLTRLLLIRRVGPGGFREQWAPRFPLLSTLGVLGIVFIAMALNAEALLAAPEMLLWILVPLILLYLATFALSTLVGRLLFARGDAIALVYGTVMRNLSIALAVAMNAFGTEGAAAALVIALGFVIQVQAAAWYVRLSNAVFGPPEPRDPAT
ncbi:arsenic resistance protein [Thioalkalivibrio sp. ALE19]|uniref:arsenic resistance protein n=1 Tax=Thioalkalivibrio sp. ALE19 TaxID=1266909 RepID=UPI000418BF64|nr:bile acid:sodium symporter [Thioalkalivibrio sp. ALE19]